MDLISVPAALFVVGAVLAVALPLPFVVRRALLLAANAAFLWCFDPLAPALFLGTSLFAFGAAKVAARGVSGPALAALCAPLLAPLFLPKLSIFTGALGAAGGAAAEAAGVIGTASSAAAGAAAAAAAGAANAASTGSFVGVRAVLFIGASYYTLRALHCVLDARRSGKLHLGLFDFLVWNSFFPTIVAGPIERADHFAQSYTRLGRPGLADLGDGLTRIFLGLLKKVALGGLLLQWAQPITMFASRGADHLEWWEAWRALYAIALYAWADFAGYSDLAIGVARLMGLRLAENFENPYLRPSIAEFWKGWHISLSFWIRDYLFLPMCGRSPSRLRPHLAALASMTLCGLWHSPNPGWALWGLAHGAGLSAHQAWTLKLRRNFKLKKRLAQSRVFRVLAVFLTFNFVALTWTLVAIDPTRLAPAWAWLQIMFGLC